MDMKFVWAFLLWKSLRQKDIKTINQSEVCKYFCPVLYYSNIDVMAATLNPRWRPKLEMIYYDYHNVVNKSCNIETVYTI